MKKLLTVIFFTLSVSSYGQSGEWTWMNGDTIPQSLGHYGTQGVFSSLNTPPSLYEACEWTDKQGNFWLYGGVLFGPNFGGPTMNDLWKFDPTINQWAWIKGSGGGTDQIGVYGTQGIPSITNTPGARGWGTPTWVDTVGNLWLFGGYTYSGYRNDLWRYNISTNEWTWMKGDTLIYQGVYGTMGVPDPANFPATRGETNATWTDSNNNLWMFGGVGNLGSHNDLWRYNISSNVWTWMKGLSTGNLDHGVYGIKGIADTANRPSVRYCYAKWIDSNDNLWFYGGYEYNTAYFGIKKDVWKYDISSNMWTWMSGDSISWDSTTVANGLCIPSINNSPAARYENRACWKVGNDNFLTFGGIGNGNYNDLWNYNFSTDEWSWISGDTMHDPPSYYGIKTVSSPLNSPPARFGSIGWKDNNCNLWFWGGVYYNQSTFQYDCLNDMWRYSLDSTCVSFTSCNNINGISTPAFMSTFSIYPNPTTGLVNVILDKSINLGTASVFDVLGQNVYTKSFIGKYVVLNCNFSKGIYFVQVTDGVRLLTKKLLIE